VIHIPDPRLARLVLIGKKTRHTFPAQYRKGTGELTSPKISVGKEHLVYSIAPFGNSGDPDAEPLGKVLIDAVAPEVIADITDADVRSEGFANLSAFKIYWNSVWRKKTLDFDKNRHHPVWVIRFRLLSVLPAGVALLERFDGKPKRRAKRKRARPKEDDHSAQED
jgi:hypothetical protein